MFFNHPILNKWMMDENITESCQINFFFYRASEGRASIKSQQIKQSYSPSSSPILFLFIGGEDDEGVQPDEETPKRYIFIKERLRDEPPRD